MRAYDGDRTRTATFDVTVHSPPIVLPVEGNAGTVILPFTDSSHTILIADYLVDPNGDTLSFVSPTENCTKGSVALAQAGAALTYTPTGVPTEVFCTITFDVTDGTNTSTGGAYQITVVTPINDIKFPPVVFSSDRSFDVDVEGFYSHTGKTIIYDSSTLRSDDCTGTFTSIDTQNFRFNPNRSSCQSSNMYSEF